MTSDKLIYHDNILYVYGICKYYIGYHIIYQKNASDRAMPGASWRCVFRFLVLQCWLNKSESRGLVFFIDTPQSRNRYPPWNLTWNPKNWWFVDVSPFPRGIFRFHVSFRGCTLPATNGLHLIMEGWKTSFIWFPFKKASWQVLD